MSSTRVPGGQITVKVLTMPSSWWKPRWALLIRVDCVSPLSSHTSARKPVGKQFDRKPTQQGGRHLESPPTGNLERYDKRRNGITHHESGTYAIGQALDNAHRLERARAQPSWAGDVDLGRRREPQSAAAAYGMRHLER